MSVYKKKTKSASKLKQDSRRQLAREKRLAKMPEESLAILKTLNECKDKVTSVLKALHTVSSQYCPRSNVDVIELTLILCDTVSLNAALLGSFDPLVVGRMKSIVTRLEDVVTPFMESNSMLMMLRSNIARSKFEKLIVKLYTLSKAIQELISRVYAEMPPKRQRKFVTSPLIASICSTGKDSGKKSSSSDSKDSKKDKKRGGDVDENNDPACRHLLKERLNLFRTQDGRAFWERFEGEYIMVPANQLLDALGKSLSTTLENTTRDMLIYVLDNSSTGRVTLHRFASFLKTFGPLRQSIATLIKLLRQPFFAGYLSPADTDRYLSGRAARTYLVRLDKLTGSCFVTAVADNTETLVNFRVRISDDNTYSIVPPSTTVMRSSPVPPLKPLTSLNALLTHYKQDFVTPITPTDFRLLFFEALKMPIDFSLRTNFRGFKSDTQCMELVSVETTGLPYVIKFGTALHSLSVFFVRRTSSLELRSGLKSETVKKVQVSIDRNGFEIKGVQCKTWAVVEESLGIGVKHNVNACVPVIETSEGDTVAPTRKSSKAPSSIKVARTSSRRTGKNSNITSTSSSKSSFGRNSDVGVTSTSPDIGRKPRHGLPVDSLLLPSGNLRKMMSSAPALRTNFVDEEPPLTPDTSNKPIVDQNLLDDSGEVGGFGGDGTEGGDDESGSSTGGGAPRKLNRINTPLVATFMPSSFGKGANGEGESGESSPSAPNKNITSGAPIKIRKAQSTFTKPLVRSHIVNRHRRSVSVRTHAGGGPPTFETSSSNGGSSGGAKSNLEGSPSKRRVRTKVKVSRVSNLKSAMSKRRRGSQPATANGGGSSSSTPAVPEGEGDGGTNCIELKRSASNRSRSRSPPGNYTSSKFSSSVVDQPATYNQVEDTEMSSSFGGTGKLLAASSSAPSSSSISSSSSTSSTNTTPKGDDSPSSSDRPSASTTSITAHQDRIPAKTKDWDAFVALDLKESVTDTLSTLVPSSPPKSDTAAGNGTTVVNGGVNTRGGDGRSGASISVIRKEYSGEFYTSFPTTPGRRTPSTSTSSTSSTSSMSSSSSSSKVQQRTTEITPEGHVAPANERLLSSDWNGFLSSSTLQVSIPRFNITLSSTDLQHLLKKQNSSSKNLVEFPEIELSMLTGVALDGGGGNNVGKSDVDDRNGDGGGEKRRVVVKVKLSLEF